MLKNYKYYLTKLGKTIITTGLTIKEMVVIPELAGFKNHLKLIFLFSTNFTIKRLNSPS